MADGKNPAQARRAARVEPTLGDLWEHFRTTHAEAKLSPRTVEGHKAQWKAHLKPWVGRRLSAVTQGDVAKLHAKSGPYMANRVLSLIGTMYARAGELGWKGNNPAKGIKRFPERERERFLQGDELPRFFKALAEEPSDTMRDFFALALLTGARRSNVAAMRWEEIDLDARTWKIPNTKSGEPVTIPLLPLAVDVLRARLEARKGEGEWVFPSRSKTGRLVAPDGAWRELLKRAGLTGLRLHDLRRTLGSWQAIMGSSLPIIGKALGRHTCASHLLAAGWPLPLVRDTLGHADASTTRVYSHVVVADTAPPNPFAFVGGPDGPATAVETSQDRGESTEPKSPPGTTVGPRA
ncbi:MAG TPA: site-specific integrase [Phycisphaerae bacterium]|nr:site-specific integrase [Phycisphaerae bacterium]